MLNDPSLFPEDRPSEGSKGPPTPARRTSPALAPDAGVLQLLPADCTVSEWNGRDLAMLDAVSCAALIASVRAAREIIEPIIVKRLADGRYEVLSGARRWWIAGWLRTNGMPELTLPAIVRDATDADAFRVAEHENRGRVDPSALEIGREYSKAVDRLYDGNQARLANDLMVREATVSNLIALARWPSEIHAAYGSGHAILEVDVTRLASAVRNSRDSIVEKAISIAGDQAMRKKLGEPPIGRGEVTTQLLSVASKAVPRLPLMIVDAEGTPLVTLRSRRSDALILAFHHPLSRDAAQASKAIAQFCKAYAAGNSGRVQLNGKVDA